MALSFLGQGYGERDHWKRPEVLHCQVERAPEQPSNCS